MQHHTTDIEVILKSLKSDSDVGLAKEEAAKRLLSYGENSFPDKKNLSFFKIFLNQFNNLLTYILLIAVVLSVMASHVADAVIILFLIAINISIGFYHQYKAEKRVLGLKNFLKPTSVVKREGQIQNIESRLLVPGDIVLLEDGKSVPADIRIINSNQLTTLESSLTGESAPVSKNNATIDHEVALGDRSNMLYLGTQITTGEAVGIVVKTGTDTELGKISSQLINIKDEKPLFYKRTDSLMKQMIAVSLLTTTITLILLISKGYSGYEIAQFSFASLISGIPEGLPSILTILLSIASVRMTRRNALLRNLPSIETLSSVTTIITDKTGTLTENVMTVKELMIEDGIVNVTGEGWSSNGDFLFGNQTIDPNSNQNLKLALKYLSITSKGRAIKNKNGYDLIGYPTEIARSILAAKAGFSFENSNNLVEILEESSYDQISKIKKSLVKDQQFPGKKILIIVGGAENILKASNPNRSFEKYVEDSANKGFRVQAIAIKLIEEHESDLNSISLEQFRPLAVVKISDPLRKDVPDAIRKAQEAGIRVIMATGDHSATAYKIAQEAGIKNIKADFQNKDVISQLDIDEMDDHQFEEVAKSYNIFARVSPSTKLRLAEILQNRGEIIAMTGDGVNDAPALKKADIGISMGMIGTDAAKEASDLILLNDSFPTIIGAIEEGRTVFRNMRQTSLYLITTNLAEDIIIIATILIGLPLPLLPIQILWLNLVTDGLSDIALATERPNKNILTQKPISTKEGIITKRDLSFIFTMAGLMAIMALSVFYREQSEGLDRARALAFSVMVFTQLFNLINMRSLDDPISKLGYFSNKNVTISLLISVMLFLGAIYLPFAKDLFQFHTLKPTEIIFTVLISSSLLIIGEIYKYTRQYFDSRNYKVTSITV